MSDLERRVARLELLLLRELPPEPAPASPLTPGREAYIREFHERWSAEGKGEVWESEMVGDLLAALDEARAEVARERERATTYRDEATAERARADAAEARLRRVQSWVDNVPGWQSPASYGQGRFDASLEVSAILSLGAAGGAE